MLGLTRPLHLVSAYVKELAMHALGSVLAMRGDAA